MSLQIEAEGPTAALHALGAESAAVSFALPPTLTRSARTENPEITFGELELELSRGNTLLARVSVCGRIALRVDTSNGQLRVLAGAQELWFTKLGGSDEFGEREMNILAAFVETALPEAMRPVFDSLPIPAQYGALLNAPGLTVAQGYVHIGDDPLP